MKKGIEGIKGIGTFHNYWQGPYATQMLGDVGAD